MAEHPVLLVASSGGHLLELLELADEYPPASRHWVTFDKPDARVLLAGERVTFAHSPTNRHLGNLIRNAFLAVRILLRIRPRAVSRPGPGSRSRSCMRPGHSAVGRSTSRAWPASINCR
jgi:hypothetical protein